MLNSDASAGVIAYVVLAVAIIGFLYLAIGPLVDELNAQHIDQTTSGTFPMSQDRNDCVGNLNLIIGAFLVVGVLAPLGLYAIVVANRDDSGEVY